MDLINYYKKILENVGMIVSEDNYVYVPTSDGDKQLIMINGCPLVLPTKDHIESIYREDDEGNYVLSKLLFNPLCEDVVKGDSESLKKLKNVIEYKLSHVVAAVGEQLLVLASDKKLQSKTNIFINKFLKEVINAGGQGVRQIVDEQSIDKWVGIYQNMIKKDDKFVKIYIKKKGKVDGETYIRLSTLASSVYDALPVEDEEVSIYGVKLRKKDSKVFKEIFKYIFDGLDENGTISVGSNNNEAPAFLSLFGLYIQVTARLNQILQSLKHVNKEVVDSYTIEGLITEDELNDIAKYKTELFAIPSEVDLSRSVASKNKIGGFDGSVVNNKTTGTINTQAYPNTPVTVQQQTQQEPVDPLRKALYGGNTPPPVQQPGFIGLNNIPVVQQPVVQPMMQPMGMSMQPNIANPGSYYQQPMMQPMGYQPMTQPVNMNMPMFR